MESRESLMDNRNDCLTESSIAKPLLGYSSDNPIGTCLIKKRGTKRKKPMLVDSNGYSYNINRRSKTARTTYWQCTHRPNIKTKRCNATVTQTDEKLRAGQHEHNHKPKKTKRQTEKLKSAKSIVTEEPDSGLETRNSPTGIVGNAEMWLEPRESDVFINPTRSPLEGGVPCLFTFYPDLPSVVKVNAIFGNIASIMLEKTGLGYLCIPPAIPNKKPDDIPVKLVSMNPEFIVAQTFLSYREELFVQENLVEEPGAHGSGRREDGSNDDRASGGGASGGGASGGRVSGGGGSGGGSRGGRSSGEGASGSGASGGGASGGRVSGGGGSGGGSRGGRSSGEGASGSGAIGGGASGGRVSGGGSSGGGSSGGRSSGEGASGSGASGGRVSGGGSSGGGGSGDGSSGGRSSGEGASGSGASGDGTGGTGEGGCGGKGCGTYGGGATGCQYRRDASQPGSDVESKLCECLKKCSVGIWRQKPSAPQNKACTESEEDLEDGQLSCTQESKENYFSDTEDCSSSETDSAFSDSESWDESLSDSSLSFRWVNSSKSQGTIPETESTQLLASHDDTPVHCLDAPDLNVENAESQYQDNELFETLHAENAKPQNSKSVLSGTSNQQSATCVGSTTQSQAAQSPVNSPLWNGDRKLNVAPPQDSDEEIHSGQEWEESVANTCIMENEANGLTDSFVARHTTDPTLRLGLLFRNQNGSRHDQGTGMGAETAGPNNTATDSSAAGSPSAEVFLTNSQASNLFALSPLNIRPWNVESLESMSNSHLALMQGVARATVQMNWRMRERELRELEREQLQTNQDRREREIRMRRNRKMIERERREMRRSGEWREWQEAGE